jgi:hypothetical protein
MQRWGVDIVVSLPIVPGSLHFAAVALEYFTKWIEAKALAKITSGTLISFVWQRIICRFGVPSYITVDNEKQFNCTEFRNFYSELGIKLAFAITPQVFGSHKLHFSFHKHEHHSSHHAFIAWNMCMQHSHLCLFHNWLLMKYGLCNM